MRCGGEDSPSGRRIVCYLFPLVSILSHLLSGGSYPETCAQRTAEGSPLLKNAWYKAVELLIEHGADPRIMYGAGRSKLTVPGFPGYFSSREERFLKAPEVLRKIFTFEKATRLEEKIAEALGEKQWVLWKWMWWT
jgi:hypothetical protein